MALGDYLPLMWMLVVQAAGAAMNIFYRLAMDDEMNIYVLITYRQLFAALATLCLAIAKEWVWRGENARPVFSRGVWIMLLCLGVFGQCASPLAYAVSLQLTSPLFVSAISNLVPGFTFLLAIISGDEHLALDTRPGKAKLIGTLLSTVGAMIITFYHGPRVSYWHAAIKILKPRAVVPRTFLQQLLGGFFAILSAALDALVFILMSRLSRVYHFQHSGTTTAAMNIIGLLGCIIMSVSLTSTTDSSIWRMGWDIRLLTTSYSGLVISGGVGIAFMWCVGQKGPVYPVAFRPLTMMLVGLMGSFIIDEPIRAEIIIGGFFICTGLWLFLWGKARQDVVVIPDDEEHRGSSATLIVPPPVIVNEAQGIEMVELE